MSEKLKGDTSRSLSRSNLLSNPANPTTTSVVKNPLLSASVTGITFDDFPNKPLLLPPVAINREPKPLVTIGSSTDVETESLDEINLNTSLEETQLSTDSAVNTGQIDSNANPLWPESNNQTTDSILSQAASSFSVLPSVASTVLSTFSKRISEYSGSNSRERTPTGDNGNLVSQLDIQPAYLQQNQQQQQYQIQQPPAPPQQHEKPSVQQQYSFYNPQTSASNAPQTTLVVAPPISTEDTNVKSFQQPEPPKFYTPTEVPILPAATATPPTSASGQNTYRLAAKKKLYAPIPGLSEQTGGGIVAAPTTNSLITAAPLQGVLPVLAPSNDPFAYPTQPSGTQLNPYFPDYQEAAVTKQEERKIGGLFANITNLVQTGVLSNISGLVQTATGSLTQTPNRPSAGELTQQPLYDYSTAYHQTQSDFNTAGAVGNFGVDVEHPVAEQPNIPLPPTYPASVEHNNTGSAVFQPASVNYQIQTPQGLTVATSPQPPLTSSQSFAPPPTTGFILTPPKSATTPAEIPRQQQPTAKTSPITYFDPTKQPSTPATYFGVSGLQSPTQASAAPITPLTTVPPSAASTFDTQQSTLHQIKFSPLPGTSTEPPRTLTPTTTTQKQSSALAIVPAANQEESQAAANYPPPPPQTFNFSSPPAIPPAVGSSQTPLPPTAANSSSFRLQKGTRLYKSPLTLAETAPAQVQAGGLIQQTLVPTPTFFNSFGSLTPTSVSNPLGGQITPTLVPSYFIPQQAESSVGLFAVDKPEAEKKQTEIPQPIYASATLQETHKGVSKDEIPQSSTTSPPSILESKKTNIESSLGTEDLGAIIQLQTIEPVLPEPAETTNLSTDKQNTSSEPTYKADNTDSEILYKAVEDLTLAPQSEKATREPQGFQLLPSENQESQVLQQQSLQTVPTLSAKQLQTSEGPLTIQHQQPFSSEQVSPVKQQPKQEQEQQLLLTSLSSGKPQATLTINTTLVSHTVPYTNPPPSQQHGQNSNPFRRSVGATPLVSAPSQVPIETQPKLANFFGDALGVSNSGVAEFKLFSPSQEIFPAEPQTSTSTIPSAESTEASLVSPPVSATSTVPNTVGLIGFIDTTQSSSLPLVLTKEATKFPALPLQSGIPPPPLIHEPPPTTTELDNQTQSLAIPPPLGFDNLLPSSKSLEDIRFGINQIATAPPLPPTEATSTILPKDVKQISNFINSNSETQQPSVVNSFSNYFNQTSNPTVQRDQLQTEQKSQEKPKISQSTAIKTSSASCFFDNFPPSQPSLSLQQQHQQRQSDQQQQRTQAQSNEDQRLQNFFNNPPQRENNVGVGDLGYDLVHSGLTVRNLGSLTSISKIVEPPSSSCSEFSELNSSNVSVRNFPAELFIKRSPEKIISAVEPPQPLAQVDGTAATSEFVSNSTNYSSDFSIAKQYADLPEALLRELGMANMLIGEKAAASVPPTTLPYSPAVKHWFYKRPTGNNKFVWTPFSHYDSALLETTLNMGDNAPNIVAVEGGRYDVNITERLKAPVYWDGAKIEVRRCSWFYKGTDSKMVPYEEAIADLLENEYKHAVASGEWHKKIVLSMNEQVTFHGPTVIVHFQQQQSSDAWGGTSQTSTRPRMVKRDLDDFTIDQGESQRVDHLLLMVHGIGAACDLKMRSVDEVVDDFRQIAQNLVQSHYKNSTEMGLVGRVEVLPISWHSHLHSEEMGIDEKLRSITLESMPILRNFTNNTILDVLLYTSPKFCQKIMNTVAASMNEVYKKYRERHPEFNGGVSVAGHSLGSLILFDLLCHQKAPKESEENLENPDQLVISPMNVSNDDSSVTSYTMGHAGTGQPFINYAQLTFQPKKFFALGSPIGMFVTIRGIDNLGLDFRLPTCAGFYNIFHPFDPVAYRVEALINPDLSGVRPVLIPHHKGRKRMHLELKETMTRVGADLKQRFFDTFKTTLESVNFLGGSSRSSREAEENITKEVDEVLTLQLDTEKQQQQALKSTNNESQMPCSSQANNNDTSRTRSDSVSTSHSDSDMIEIDFPLGKLNDSKRIDYVLQEAPLEFISEYLFALGAHVCYWESEDTILFVMREIYTGLGISPDSQVPQQTMTIERPSSRNSHTLSLITEKR